MPLQGHAPQDCYCSGKFSCNRYTAAPIARPEISLEQPSLCTLFGLLGQRQLPTIATKLTIATTPGPRITIGSNNTTPRLQLNPPSPQRVRTEGCAAHAQERWPLTRGGSTRL